MIRPRIFIFAALITAMCSSSQAFAGLDADREALRKTGEAIRAAFARGDVGAIIAYHHPDVVKALAYDRYLAGRNAVAADLRQTFQHVRLEFTENRLESMLIQGDTAVELALFALKVTPKDGGEPFVFRGRAMVVYVRYKESPTGWASIRETVQAAQPEK